MPGVVGAHAASALSPPPAPPRGFDNGVTEEEAAAAEAAAAEAAAAGAARPLAGEGLVPVLLSGGADGSVKMWSGAVERVRTRRRPATGTDSEVVASRAFRTSGRRSLHRGLGRARGARPADVWPVSFLLENVGVKSLSCSADASSPARATGAFRLGTQNARRDVDTRLDPGEDPPAGEPEEERRRVHVRVRTQHARVLRGRERAPVRVTDRERF